jgi:hypothetical protein
MVRADRFALLRGHRPRPADEACLADDGVVRSRRVGSGEPELLLLVRPDCRQIAYEPGDGEIGRPSALGDRLDDARREIGERRQEPDVSLGKVFLSRDRVVRPDGRQSSAASGCRRPRRRLLLLHPKGQRGSIARRYGTMEMRQAAAQLRSIGQAIIREELASLGYSPSAGD